MDAAQAVLIDGQGGTWEPSTLTPGSWDLVDVQGEPVVYALSGWTRSEIEATWPPTMAVSESEEEAA
jgi:hypothetical protein